MKDENIVFSSGILGDKDNSKEDDDYRKKYEEALIKIED
jgi:hypothetical protein